MPAAFFLLTASHHSKTLGEGICMTDMHSSCCSLIKLTVDPWHDLCAIL